MTSAISVDHCPGPGNSSQQCAWGQARPRLLLRPMSSHQTTSWDPGTPESTKHRARLDLRPSRNHHQSDRPSHETGEPQPVVHVGLGWTWVPPMTPTFLKDHIARPWNSSQQHGWAGPEPGTSHVSKCWPPTSGPSNSRPRQVPPKSKCCH